MPKSKDTVPALDKPETAGSRSLGSLTQMTSMRLIAIIAVFAVLYFARALFLPIVLAIILTLTLTPFVQWGQKLRIPAAFTAAFLIISTGFISITSVVTLAPAVADLLSQAPDLGERIKDKLKVINEPLESINKVGEEVDKIAESKEGSFAQTVVVKQPGLVSRAADDIIAFGANIILTLTLGFFLLSSRDLFYLKVVRVLPSLSDRKKALRVAKQVEEDVSGYLLTVTVINLCLGLSVGVTLWFLDMPSPVLFGLMAALLNYLPYVGAIFGIMITAAVAFLAFEDLYAIALPPLAYMTLTVLEGQFITPVALSKRFSLNTVVIIISIALWGFMWGAVGVVIAVPLLIILKALCDRVESLASLGEFLSGEDRPDAADDENSHRAQRDAA